MMTKPVKQPLDQGRLTVLLDEGFTWVTTWRDGPLAKIVDHSETEITIEYPGRPCVRRIIGFHMVKAVHKEIEEKGTPMAQALAPDYAASTDEDMRTWILVVEASIAIVEAELVHRVIDGDLRVKLVKRRDALLEIEQGLKKVEETL